MKLILFFTLIMTYSFQGISLSLTNPSLELEKALNQLYKLPEFKGFLHEIEKEGPITLEMKPLQNEDFDAFWVSSSRTIRLNSLKNKTVESLACSILFELHNAKSDREFKNFYHLAAQGKISKTAYVEGVEKMEHRNALNCSLLLENGIRLGLFSEKAAWPILHEFEDHYKLQQIKGHSLWIAKHYEAITPFKCTSYQGTLPTFSAGGKEEFLRYLIIKKNIESRRSDQNVEGLIALQKEVEKAMENKERLHFLYLIFHKLRLYQALIQAS